MDDCSDAKLGFNCYVGVVNGDSYSYCIEICNDGRVVGNEVCDEGPT